ncbi:putative transcriptional regulator [Xenococcus sp. PCC 7305]|uniref:helix-turn-helix transcriptional regulator n=1 Tax=Xenococcus sp. PCC 7305 TaxID=102125 RepID=UPI0002ABBF9E|nr:helix-turn-helix transcriptional regulator [Xenococcus sp. PCC 7305]ELS01103.1 putative transcriptional regulator [Xenococcus sp. PCC 7305]
MRKFGRPKKGVVQSTTSPFKKLRLQAELTQEQMAQEIVVTVSTIRRWEKSQAEPTMTVAQMKRFCKVTGAELSDLPDTLLENTEEPIAA